MAIEGDGFYQVKTSDGKIQYTRDGNFNVSPTEQGNLLVTADGDQVLDQMGNSIYLPTEYSAADVVISEEGVVSFPDETGNPAPLTANGYTVQLGLYQFNNPAGLDKVGNNNFSVTVASGEAISEYNNNNLTSSKVHQKYTESSNVDVANEMVNLIVAQRAYEMNSKAIQATDEMMQQANSLRR
jgi:flagellar basal-body rod protein FlgG